MRGTCRQLICGIGALGWATMAPAWAETELAKPISPGSADGITAVASACPTFSWTAAEGARGYELVVYEAPEAGDARSVGAQPKRTEPVLRQRIAGAGLSWTPPADGCLALAGAYAWSVRALGDDGEGDWSDAALFRIEPAVPVGELAAVLERVLGRYLESRGLPPAPDGRLAGLISEELAGGAAAAAPQSPPRRVVYSGGRRHLLEEGEPIPRGVFTDEVELVLSESGSGTADYVQLVFTTPEFDGDPINGDAWAIRVDANDSMSSDDGTMSISTPGFIDVAQFYTDGSAIIGELREMSLRPRSDPPNPCTSLQEGMFYWDDDISLLCVCDGSSWDTLDGDATGSCS